MSFERCPKCNFAFLASAPPAPPGSSEPAAVKKENNIEEFCWGTKQPIIHKPEEIIDLLFIKKGGFSSIHKHEYQNNLMLVLNGKIEIRYYNGYNYKIYTEQINQYQHHLIDYWSAHQFYALEDSRVIEIITPANGSKTVTRDDIIRLTERGIDK